jgi:hypothetical protein
VSPAASSQFLVALIKVAVNMFVLEGATSDVSEALGRLLTDVLAARYASQVRCSRPSPNTHPRA